MVEKGRRGKEVGEWNDEVGSGVKVDAANKMR